MLVAGGLALAVTGDSQSPADQQAVQGMMEFGAAVGATAYSPEMELEADRTAIYILAGAGYDTRLDEGHYRSNASRGREAKARRFHSVRGLPSDASERQPPRSAYYFVD